MSQGQKPDPALINIFTLINSIIQSPSMAPTNDYGEADQKKKKKMTTVKKSRKARGKD